MLYIYIYIYILFFYSWNLSIPKEYGVAARSQHRPRQGCMEDLKLTMQQVFHVYNTADVVQRKRQNLLSILPHEFLGKVEYSISLPKEF